MEKFRELHPKEKKYLENLFKTSQHFQDKVKELRSKYDIQISSESWMKVESLYSDTINFFRTDERLATTTYTKVEFKKWESFHEDIWKLATYFHIQNYLSYFKKYMLGRNFEPLSFQKIIHYNLENITVEIPYQISKTEFIDIWEDIEFIKNSKFWKKVIQSWKVSKKYKNDFNFDDKFFYHKENKTWTPIPEYLMRKIINESNKYKRIREIEDAKNILVT